MSQQHNPENKECAWNSAKCKNFPYLKQVHPCACPSVDEHTNCHDPQNQNCTINHAKTAGWCATVPPQCSCPSQSKQSQGGEKIKQVIEGILEIADKERKESEPYKDMFKRTEGKPFPVQLMDVEGKLISVLLDYSAILKEHGYEVGKETWEFLLALPLSAYLLEKDIIKNEGHTCCVDKTYTLLHKEFIRTLKKTS